MMVEMEKVAHSEVPTKEKIETCSIFSNMERPTPFQHLLVRT